MHAHAADLLHELLELLVGLRVSRGLALATRVFAYGSLVESESRFRTIGARGSLIERVEGGALTCEVSGYRRAFAVAMRNRPGFVGELTV